MLRASPSDPLCSICGNQIASNLFSDIDRLGETWYFHQNCYDKFTVRDFSKKK